MVLLSEDEGDDESLGVVLMLSILVVPPFVDVESVFVGVELIPSLEVDVVVL